MSPKEAYIKVWEDTYTVHSYEVDCRKNATLQIICRYLQESAWNHAEHLELGYSHLSNKGLFWVLTRQIVRIFVFPRWGEKIVVHTWPTGNDRLFCFRDFKMLNERGEVIGVAATTWAVLDKTRRRLQKTETYLHLEPSDLEPALERRPNKLDLPGTPTLHNEFQVGYADLDVNGHVNNVKYIDWIMSYFSLEFQKNHTLREFEINYLAEIVYNEKLRVATEEVSSNEYRHTIKRVHDAAELCRAYSLWE